jgi:tetratricopeptide (TPR) repeat protein
LRRILAAFLMFAAAPAAAENQDEYLVKCLTATDNGPDAQIAACTAAIQRGRPTETWFAYGMRANGYVAAKRWDEAIADFTKAIELKPDDPVGYENRGWAYEEKGELDKAIENYRQATKLDPNYEAARENLLRLGVKP